MEEIWKPMVGKEKFLVSNMGRIMRKDTGHIFPQNTTHKGYVYCSLCDNGKPFKAICHIEVAKAFIRRETWKTQVNHIDGDKNNNRADNLEWCTAHENMQHAFRVLGITAKNKRKVMCIETGETFESCADAAKSKNGLSPSIVDCCRGKRKHHRGYSWKYV